MTTAARRTRAPGPPPGRIHPRRPKGTPAMDQPATRQRSVGRRPAATHHSASSRPPALLEAAGLESLVRARHPSTGAHSRTPWWGRRSTSPRSCRRSLPDIPLRLERGRQLHWTAARRGVIAAVDARDRDGVRYALRHELAVTRAEDRWEIAAIGEDLARDLTEVAIRVARCAGGLLRERVGGLKPERQPRVRRLSTSARGRIRQ
jgi:hypothetical protein